MFFWIFMRFFFIIPVAPTITGTISVFFSFQDLLTSFLRSWYLVIFLISVLFWPKSLGTNTSISNAVLPFCCFIPKYYIWSQWFVFCVHAWWDHHIIHECYFLVSNYCYQCYHGLCFHDFSDTGILKFLQMCQWITRHTLCLCVYSCSDMSFLVAG